MGGYTTRLGCPVDSCWISADVSQLKQVLVNLARNAMEAMGPGGGAGGVEQHGDDLVLVDVL